MAYENRKYVIINASEVGTVDFSQVHETSASTLRYSLDDSQTFVKFDGDTPSFLDGKTQYNHSQIRTILAGEDWHEELEIE
jgi:hypothetical protein|tara:strand:- start:980 stop:1222 length:243 start_codon:yes stop_codon:yes gene_type:complete